MARLPSVGGDTNAWGTILNQYLQVAHNAGGTNSGVMTRFNPRDDAYGATGNGITDDTTALQNAINDATATRTNGSAFGAQGAGLYLDRGLYLISQPLTIPWPITIDGAGWGTEIFLKNGANCDMIQFNPQASDWFNGAKISNIKLNGNNANQTAASSIINAKGAVWCEFDHIWFEAMYTYGLYLHDDNLGGYGHHNYVSHCFFNNGENASGTGASGTGLYTHNSDETRIHDNVFQHCGTAGGSGNNAAYFDDAGLQSIIGNVFVADPAKLSVNQMKLASTRYNVISNIVDGGTFAQLLLPSGASNATILGNYFYQPINNSPCIYLGSGSGYTIDGNVFESSSTANASNCAVDASSLAANSVKIGSNNQVVTNGTWANAGGIFVSANTSYTGSGVPAAGLGNNGDYYFRTDTPGTANQRIYVKSAGAWVGIV